MINPKQLSPVENLRQEILAFLKQHKISKREFSFHLQQRGFSSNTIRAFLTGSYNPSRKTLPGIAEAFEEFAFEASEENIFLTPFSKMVPEIYLLEVVLSRPKAEQLWILEQLGSYLEADQEE